MESEAPDVAYSTKAPDVASSDNFLAISDEINSLCDSQYKYGIFTTARTLMLVSRIPC